MGGLDDRADRRRVGSGPLQPLQSRVDFGDTIRQSRQFATTVLLQVRVRRRAASSVRRRSPLRCVSAVCRICSI